MRDPRLVEPEPVTITDDIVAAFEISKRRLLITGKPGSGKTIAAYSLIEHLDEREGAEGRIPLLVNLSAWEAQDDIEAFLVDYLCSSVGYQVRERAVASAFIGSDRYNLVLDGLDEIPVGLRAHFPEQLDEFVRGLPGVVGMVVTCRTQEYEEILACYRTGLGLVQAVEILPLSSEQLDCAIAELAKLDEDWEAFLSQRHLTAYKRVRDLLSNPLLLNLAVVGHLSPGQLLDWSTTEQELRDLVLDRYLHRTIAEQSQYDPEDAHRYLTWIVHFLNGDEVSPFGLKTSDYSVFNLANLTPPERPRRLRYLGALAAGLVVTLVYELVRGLVQKLVNGELIAGMPFWLVILGPLVGLIGALVLGLTRRPLVEVIWTLVFSLSMTITLLVELALEYTSRDALYWLIVGVTIGIVGVLLIGWPYKHSAISSRLTLVWPLTRQQRRDFVRRAGREASPGTEQWRVVRVAAKRRSPQPRSGWQPPFTPYDFLEWGIKQQIFRRVGGGVRFRHNLIQQHLVNTSEEAA